MPGVGSAAVASSRCPPNAGSSCSRPLGATAKPRSCDASSVVVPMAVHCRACPGRGTGALRIWRFSTPTRAEDPCDCDPMRACELLVGLGDVTVLGADDDPGARSEFTSRPARSGRRARPVAGWCGPRTSGPSSWSIWRRSDGRLGWCGTSSAGPAQHRCVRSDPSPRPPIASAGHDGSGWAVGDRAGRPPQAQRQRGRRRARLRLAHDQRHRHRLWHPAGRRPRPHR